MRHSFFVLILVCLTLVCRIPVVSAEIYTWTDDSGTVVFSDQPHAGARKMDTPESQSYTAPDIPTNTDSNDQAASQAPSAANNGKQPYSRLAIEQPANDSSVRANNGNVEVDVSVTPDLDTESGDHLVFYVDDNSIAPSSTDPRIVLENIDRGTHQLRVEIRDKDDTVLMTSKPVIFHLQRHSALFEKPPPNPLPAE